MRNLLERIERFWCLAMHSEIMWPSQGGYQCRTCLRRYPVNFAGVVESETVSKQRFHAAAPSGVV